MTATAQKKAERETQRQERCAHSYRPRAEPVLTRRYDAVLVPMRCTTCSHRRDVELTLDEAAAMFPLTRPRRAA